MFDYLEGDLVGKSPTQVVVATGGVGYRLTIPLSTFDALPRDGRVKLLVHLYVREAEMRLYGFAGEDERRLFVRLIAIQGIGPGTAIAVLNGMSVDDFHRAIVSEEISAIAKAKGIGRKTAERLIVELKGEMERELAERPVGRRAVAAPTSDAVAAMLALGYRRSVSEKAVTRALEALGRAASLEDVIRRALQEV